VGLVLLILIATALASAVAVISIALEALRPRRRTVSWALANGTPADPEALGLSREQWREWSVRSADGLELPVWELDGAESAGPIVVIVHGWGRSRWDSLRRVPSLLSFASKIVLPDLRGHGEAPGRTRLGAVEVDDLRRLLDQLHTSNATRVILIGHSMGASIVLRCALSMLQRDRAPSSGLSSAPLVVPRIAGVMALAPYDRVVTPIAARLRLRALPRWPFASLAVALLRLAGIRDRSLSLDAARLAVPLLVITAEDDVISPAADGRAIAAAVPDSRGRMTTMPGGHHADPGIEDPIVFDQLLREFITSGQQSSDAAG